MLRFLLVLTLLASLPAEAQFGKRPLHSKRPGARKGAMLDRFSTMSPEERQKVLDRMPAERRKQMERNIERYNKMSPMEKEKLNAQVESFRSMPSERQKAARRLAGQMNDLPDDRRREVRRAMARLRNMPESDRKARLTSEEYKTRFSADERKLIEESLDVFPPE